MRSILLGVLCASVATISLLSAPSVYGITGPAPGAVAKPADFVITLPWADGVEGTILEAYGDAGNQGTDDQCCRNDFYALDVHMLPGHIILPVAAGTVIFAGATTGSWADMGNAVIIDHGNGYQSLYGGLRTVSSDIYNGKYVEAYTMLGTSGGMGIWRPLHFALYQGALFDVNAGPYGGRAVVPEPFANCIKDSEYSCENLKKGNLLSSVTAIDMTKGLIVLGWTAPPNALQYHIQVIPLRNDGPGVNLIIGDQNMVQSGLFYVFPPVFGTGNYVMLPGAHYSWRIRFSAAPYSIGEDDPSWGTWSMPKWISTNPPSSSSITLVEPASGSLVADSTPTIRWSDAERTNFYYEVQVSADPEFRTGNDAVATVYWNLVHGGVASPLNSWTIPAGFELPGGTYYFRVRQRVQATLFGIEEQGIPWTPAQSFTVAQ